MSNTIEKLNWIRGEIRKNASQVEDINFYHHFISQLNEVDLIIEKHIERIIDFKKVWSNRVGASEKNLFLLVNMHFDTKGNLKYTWSPHFPKYDDTKTATTLIKMNYGLGGNEFQIDRIKLLTNRINNFDQKNEQHQFIRNILWSTSLINDYFVDKLQEIENINSEKGDIISFNIKGEIKESSHDLNQLERYNTWVEVFENRYNYPLGNLIYAHSNNYTPQEVKDMTRLFPREMTYAEASHAIRDLNNIIQYNKAWWRRTALINLPKEIEPTRIIPENKNLIQIKGNKPRLSPIGIRGFEGSNIKNKAELKDAIISRIETKNNSWHFSAGDFSDFVEQHNRIEIVNILDRLKQKGHITSVYKGIYVLSSDKRDPILALKALIRDRGELLVPSGERALCLIGVSGNPFNPPTSFYTNGTLKNFYSCETKIKIFTEPVSGFCAEALACQNPIGFIAAAHSLINGEPSVDLIKDALWKNGFKEEFERASIFTGRFL